MRLNAILLILFIFSILLSGCDLFDSCETYCKNDVIHHCSNDGGLFGGTDDWYTEDCKEDGLICLEKGNTAYCVFKSDRCNASTDSFCTDENASASCIEKNGKFYAINADSCYSSDNEVCVQFGSEAKCVVPSEDCNSKSKSVCLENKPVDCFEKDGDFFIEIGYDRECYDYEECVEVDNTAMCLRPVDFCIPSTDLHCIGNKQGRCWEKNGRYYASFSYDCDWIDDSICLELSNGDLECLIPINECDSTTESFCVNDSVAVCFEKDGSFYFDRKYYCNSCIYDPETKSAHCLSDEE